MESNFKRDSASICVLKNMRIFGLGARFRIRQRLSEELPRQTVAFQVVKRFAGKKWLYREEQKDDA